MDISQSFYVRPVNVLGEGPASDKVNLQTILSSSPSLDHPQLLTALNIEPMKIMLSWFPPRHPPHDIVSVHVMSCDPDITPTCYVVIV